MQITVTRAMEYRKGRQKHPQNILCEFGHLENCVE